MIDTPMYVVDDPEKNRSERGAKARLSFISASALNATVLPPLITSIVLKLLHDPVNYTRLKILSFCP